MKDDKILLRRIIEAIEKIERYSLGKTVADFANDEELYDAILMNLVVIGEEANQLSTNTKEKYPEIPWHKMIGMRNLISHDYFSVKPQIVWETTQDSIPELREVLKKVL